MTETHQDDTVVQDAALSVPSPGQMVCSLREKAGLSQAAVGAALHLTVHYIKALENDEYGKLPALTFVKGYFRAYARFLKTDPEVILASFEAHMNSLNDADDRTEKVQRIRRRQDQALRWAVATGIVVVIAVAAGWWFTGKPTAQSPAGSIRQIGNAPVIQSPAPTAEAPVIAQDSFQTFDGTPPDGSTQDSFSEARTTDANLEDEAATDTASSYAPATNADDAAALPANPDPDFTADIADDSAGDSNAEPTGELAASAGALSIVPGPDGSRALSLISSGDDHMALSFTGSSWVEIDDAENIRLYSDLLRSGDTLSIQGHAPFHVLLGDATHVEVSLNDNKVDITPDIRPDSSARLVLGTAASAAGI